MIDALPQPGSAAPVPPDPAPDRVAEDAAATQALEGRQVDEMSAIALNLLRVLHLEVVDPHNSPTCVPGEWISATDPTLAYTRLTRAVRLNLAARARMNPDDEVEAALRRQGEVKLVVEMSAIGMDMLRMLQLEAIDPMSAATVRQGLRVGAGDPGLALFRLTRAVRLNHAIRAKITEGTLGRRKSRRQAPTRPEGPAGDDPGSTPPAGGDHPTASAAGADHPTASATGAAPAAARAAIEAQLAAIAALAAETDGVETEFEDLREDYEDLEEEDEFACLDDCSREEQRALVERTFARATKAARPGRPGDGTAAGPAIDQPRHPSAGAPAEDAPPAASGGPAAPPPETGGPAARPSDTGGPAAPPVPCYPRRPPPGAGGPTPDPREAAPAERPFRAPGRDPP